MGRKDYAQARELFLEGRGLDASSADIYYGLGYTAQKQGDQAYAIDNYCKALRYGGNDPTIAQDVGGMLAQLGARCP